jgi:hypothetical protein
MTYLLKPIYYLLTYNNNIIIFKIDFNLGKKFDQSNGPLFDSQND